MFQFVPILIFHSMTLFGLPPHTVQAAEGGCSFQNNGCTYNVQLHYKDDAIVGADSVKCDPKPQEFKILDRAQSDYSAKIDQMEQNLSFLKDVHEEKIKNLESTMERLTQQSQAKTISTLPLSQTVGRLSGFSLRNRNLMRKFEGEFDRLRGEIRRKTNELLEAQIKLNETLELLHAAQLQHFKSSQDLLDKENQITQIKRENAILKNQLKDRAYKLQKAGDKLTACEAKSLEQEDRIVKLFRSEATLKEELQTEEMEHSLTKKEMAKLKKEHLQLKIDHDDMKHIIKKREKELMKCYAAKTSTYCGFEDPRLCGFVNVQNSSVDFFNWTRAQGRTPSGNTGPSKDHTCDGPNGHFMYIEASAKGKGNNAILYSPLYRGLGEQCLEFFYHMNGRNIGTLNVYAQGVGDRLRSVWRAYGNQGDVWTHARLAIPRVLAKAGYKIAFEGITELGYQGDMAIDDVTVNEGPCPNNGAIIPVKIKVSSEAVLKAGRSFARKIRKRKRKMKEDREKNLTTS